VFAPNVPQTDTSDFSMFRTVQQAMTVNYEHPSHLSLLAGWNAYGKCVMEAAE